MKAIRKLNPLFFATAGITLASSPVFAADAISNSHVQDAQAVVDQNQTLVKEYQTREKLNADGKQMSASQAAKAQRLNATAQDAKTAFERIKKAQKYNDVIGHGGAYQRFLNSNWESMNEEIQTRADANVQSKVAKQAQKESDQRAAAEMEIYIQLVFQQKHIEASNMRATKDIAALIKASREALKNGNLKLSEELQAKANRISVEQNKFMLNAPSELQSPTLQMVIDYSKDMASTLDSLIQTKKDDDHTFALMKEELTGQINVLTKKQEILRSSLKVLRDTLGLSISEESLTTAEGVQALTEAVSRKLGEINEQAKTIESLKTDLSASKKTNEDLEANNRIKQHFNDDLEKTRVKAQTIFDALQAASTADTGWFNTSAKRVEKMQDILKENLDESGKFKGVSTPYPDDIKSTNTPPSDMQPKAQRNGHPIP